MIKHYDNITGVDCNITSIKPYVPIVTLFINDNIKFFENITHGFKRTISWKKCRSEVKTGPKNNNLNWMIDPKFRNINKLLVL